MTSDPETDNYDSEGTLSTDDGEVFIKPATDAEIQFYDDVRANYPEVAKLCPEYYGSLVIRPEHTASIEAATQDLLDKHSVPDSGHHKIGEHAPMHPKIIHTKRIASKRGVALEALTHGFKKPNTLDVKLGIRLWADDAAQEKKDRFNKVTDETTHKNLGFRFAGMKVWQGHDEPRARGHVDKQGFRIYDKEYGRFDVNDDNVHEAFRTFLFEPKAGVDAKLGGYVAEAFLKEVEKMQKVLEGLESRMYSASILFVYEGDGDALRHAIEEHTRVENGELSTTMNGNGTNGSAGSDESSAGNHEPRIFSCKLIDMAHAKIGAGAGPGPDKNMLTGIKSVAEILKQVATEGPIIMDDAEVKADETKAIKVNGTASRKAYI